MADYSWPKNKPPVQTRLLDKSRHPFGPPHGVIATLEELLPCPCCGEIKPWFYREVMGWADSLMYWSVICVCCGLRTPKLSSPQDPIDQWNRRPEPKNQSPSLTETRSSAGAGTTALLASTPPRPSTPDV